MKKNTNKMFDLSGRVACVTGGGRGIGEACAISLAEAGADVAITDINAESGEKTAERIRKLGQRAVAVSCDVTDSKAVNEMLKSVFDTLGGLDILFNNAGICIHSPAEEMTDQEWSAVMRVNLDAVFFCARAAAGLMKSSGQGGSIINVASMSGSIVNRPQPQCAYNASKAGVIQLTRSLSVEWARFGIRVNSISPGYTGTEMVRSALVKEPLWEKQWLADTPMGRLADPREIAGPVVFLASNAASFVTGHDLVIDGGFTCM